MSSRTAAKPTSKGTPANVLADVERLAMTVVAAMVIGGEHRALVVAPGEQPGCERNARDDPDASLARRGQHLLKRLEAKAVENDLDGRHVWARDRRNRLGACLHRHAVRANPPPVHHLVQGLEYGVILEHPVGRAVELDEIELLDTEIGARERSFHLRKLWRL